ncbi:hypothetical protein [Luteipulveratus mongoliensis]|uniref:hypothetical protein n=1 Tax=Luteipulveratus mongoliensis TaxID=571913 RepID=UPI0012EE7B62|nr:hypothetical protein [Luteipulveratus mongoliensis]
MSIVADRASPRIFAHFLDHEILAAISTDARIPVDKLGRLLTLAMIVSPEPVLIPISVHHESSELADLLWTLRPLVDRAMIAFVGPEDSPLDNLHARKLQYANDREIFSPMFSPVLEEHVRIYDEGWIQKLGSTSAAIAQWWNASATQDGSDLIKALFDAPPSAWQVEQIISVPLALRGRPLIGALIGRELQNLGLHVAGGKTTHTSRLLTQQWAKSYAIALDAMVCADLGPELRFVPGLVPPGVAAISMRSAWRMLESIGLIGDCAQSLMRLPASRLADVFSKLATERQYLASLVIGTAMGDHTFEASWFRIARAIRAKCEPEDSIETLLSTFQRQFEIEKTREEHLMIDNSINISGGRFEGSQLNAGQANVENRTGQVDPEILRVLAWAVGSARNSELFLQSLNSEPHILPQPEPDATSDIEEPEEVSASELTSSESAKGRLRTLRENLLRNATSSTVIAAVISNIDKLLG